MFYLMTHSTHFIYGYMASDIFTLYNHLHNYNNSLTVGYHCVSGVSVDIFSGGAKEEGGGGEGAAISSCKCISATPIGAPIYIFGPGLQYPCSANGHLNRGAHIYLAPGGNTPCSANGHLNRGAHIYLAPGGNTPPPPCSATAMNLNQFRDADAIPTYMHVLQ